MLREVQTPFSETTFFAGYALFCYNYSFKMHTSVTMHAFPLSTAGNAQRARKGPDSQPGKGSPWLDIAGESVSYWIYLYTVHIFI